MLQTCLAVFLPAGPYILAAPSGQETGAVSPALTSACYLGGDESLVVPYLGSIPYGKNEEGSLWGSGRTQDYEAVLLVSTDCWRG